MIHVQVLDNRNRLLQERRVECLPCTIGRSADNDIVIADTGVSAHHAVLEMRGGALSLRDLESSNGLVVDGEKKERISSEGQIDCFMGRIRVVITPIGALVDQTQIMSPDEGTQATSSGKRAMPVELDYRPLVTAGGTRVNESKVELASSPDIKVRRHHYFSRGRNGSRSSRALVFGSRIHRLALLGGLATTVLCHWLQAEPMLEVYVLALANQLGWCAGIALALSFVSKLQEKPWNFFPVLSILCLGSGLIPFLGVIKETWSFNFGSDLRVESLFAAAYAGVSFCLLMWLAFTVFTLISRRLLVALAVFLMVSLGSYSHLKKLVDQGDENQDFVVMGRVQQKLALPMRSFTPERDPMEKLLQSMDRSIASVRQRAHADE